MISIFVVARPITVLAHEIESHFGHLRRSGIRCDGSMAGTRGGWSSVGSMLSWNRW